MKRLWLGIFILAALAALGIWATVGISHICQPLSDSLNQAADRVQEGQWELALALSQDARQQWEQWQKLTASVTNHQPMEEVDALFGALEVYARQRDALRFADCCARLSAVTSAIAEAQAIYWWNIL